jgi:hypothetical protein
MSVVKIRGSTPNLPPKLRSLSAGEGTGIPGVAVECIDIRKNTGCEGEFLD